MKISTINRRCNPDPPFEHDINGKEHSLNVSVNYMEASASDSLRFDNNGRSVYLFPKKENFRSGFFHHTSFSVYFLFCGASAHNGQASLLFLPSSSHQCRAEYSGFGINSAPHHAYR